MHDPMTVAFELRRPIPKRWPHGRILKTDKRWQARHAWATWRRPWEGWRAFWNIAGRTFWFPPVLTIWHVEPNNRDTRPPCGSKHWRWHVHHWKLQVHPVQRLLGALFTRCELCKRRGSPNVSHRWHRESGPWWKGKRGLYHAECSELVLAREAIAVRNRLIRSLAVDAGLTPDRVGSLALVPHRNPDDLRGQWTIDWDHRRTLKHVLGHEAATYEWAKS